MATHRRSAQVRRCEDDAHSLLSRWTEIGYMRREEELLTSALSAWHSTGVAAKAADGRPEQKRAEARG